MASIPWFALKEVLDGCGSGFLMVERSGLPFNFSGKYCFLQKK